MSDPARKPLISGVSQFEVDFVIPRVGVDLQLGIDPFLLFKSREPALRAQHELMVRAFNVGIDAVFDNRADEARRLFDFPEPPEIGFGYTVGGRRGTGVGPYKAELIIETARSSPQLEERGLKHIEELQLLSVGIGPDRVSDMAANLLKDYLIRYTQRQAALWSIPLRTAVPVNHVLDNDSLEWYDGHFDLPVSPTDGRAILLVPRRIVRVLPWINYEDFLRAEFSAFLRAKRARQRVDSGVKGKAQRITKESVVKLTRSEIERVERYVRKKEEAAAQAQPTLDYLDSSASCPAAERLQQSLNRIAPGHAHASEYQRVVLEILNYLFNPELIDGRLEVRTIEGTERRDIIFTNDSDRTFWSYLRHEHSGILLMFEVKNKRQVELADLNQSATYLGDRLGRVGFVVSRESLSERGVRKAFSIYNDSNPRKILLNLADTDLERMLEMKCRGQDPMRHMQQTYRNFRTSVQ